MSTDVTPLDQIRTRLLARRTELQQRQQRIGQDLSRQYEPLSNDSSDRAIQLENDESLEAIDRAAGSELEAIDTALARVAQGSYGVCTMCGEQIAAERLAAVPHAAVCQSCGQR
ncbi:TraR/DksA family transcriptional regulator [Peristeroidobacter soli]|uniref:TraR/DksA family transcriptional regulator n=1 Tax=Peristeroidobacter soli TaxID=2497877 RepID=UPI00101D6075|nr:TraR/DksA C4-type zinc finger protein [Peristeroidobacter soli]